MLTKEVKYLINKLDKDNLAEKDIKKINDFFFSFEEYLTEDVDAILVFASSAIKRIEKAVEIYKRKRVKIIISGANKTKDGLLEYERYFIYAITHGVEWCDLILEDKSTNTLENALNSITILKNMNIKKCALVTSTQHMPRAILTLNKALKEKNLTEITFYKVVCYATLVPKDKWQEEKVAKNIIKGELERLLRYKLI